MHLRIARPNSIGPSDFTGKLGFKYQPPAHNIASRVYLAEISSK
jgi:hypothetical protein